MAVARGMGTRGGSVGRVAILAAALAASAASQPLPLWPDAPEDFKPGEGSRTRAEWDRWIAGLSGIWRSEGVVEGKKERVEWVLRHDKATKRVAFRGREREGFQATHPVFSTFVYWSRTATVQLENAADLELRPDGVPARMTLRWTSWNELEGTFALEEIHPETSKWTPIPGKTYRVVFHRLLPRVDSSILVRTHQGGSRDFYRLTLKGDHFPSGRFNDEYPYLLQLEDRSSGKMLTPEEGEAYSKVVTPTMMVFEVRLKSPPGTRRVGHSRQLALWVLGRRVGALEFPPSDGASLRVDAHDIRDGSPLEPDLAMRRTERRRGPGDLVSTRRLPGTKWFEVAPGSYEVETKLFGYRPATYPVPNVLPGETRFVRIPLSPAEDLEVRGRATRRWNGAVLPVPGARVRMIARTPGRPDAVKEATTDAEGRYRFTYAADGGRGTRVVRVTKAGFTGPGARAVTGEVLDFHLARTWGEVTGRVADGRDRPIAGAMVGVIMAGAAGQTFSSSTGADGRYVVPRVPLGRVGALRVEKPGYVTYLARDLGSGGAIVGPEVPVTLDARLDPGGAEISGTVRGAGGEPLAGAEIWNGPYSADRTTAAGTFDFVLAVGDDGFWVKAKGHRDKQVTDPRWKKPGSYRVEVRLEEVIRVRGHVTDELGRGLSGVTVDGGLGAVTTSSSGAYTLEVEPEARTIRVHGKHVVSRAITEPSWHPGREYTLVIETEQRY